jgi:hypothetical protein
VREIAAKLRIRGKLAGEESTQQGWSVVMRPMVAQRLDSRSSVRGAGSTGRQRTLAEAGQHVTHWQGR